MKRLSGQELCMKIQAVLRRQQLDDEKVFIHKGTQHLVTLRGASDESSRLAREEFNSQLAELRQIHDEELERLWHMYRLSLPGNATQASALTYNSQNEKLL